MGSSLDFLHFFFGSTRNDRTSTPSRDLVASLVQLSRPTLRRFALCCRGKIVTHASPKRMHRRQGVSRSHLTLDIRHATHVRAWTRNRPAFVLPFGCTCACFSNPVVVSSILLTLRVIWHCTLSNYFIDGTWSESRWGLKPSVLCLEWWQKRLSPPDVLITYVASHCM